MMESILTMVAGLLFTIVLAVVILLAGWGIGLLLADLMWKVTEGRERDDSL